MKNDVKAGQHSCLIEKSERAGGEFHLLRLRCPEIAQKCVPGQFVEARASEGFEPLWRRPISIHSVDGNSFELLFQIRGKGTKYLAALAKGEWLNIIGPLGNGFVFPADCRRVVLIGGGCGMAPLTFAAQHARAKKLETISLCGINHWDDYIFVGELIKLGVPLHVATMDGSYGAQGLVTQLFPAHLQNPDASTLVLSCGPMLMLNAVHDYLKDTSSQCQVSLENLMACGIGCCLGCVVKTRNAQGVEQYTRVCHEGPVFSSRVICWGVDHETGCRANS